MLQRFAERYPSVLLVSIVAVFVLVTLRFAEIQALWVDETTQLSGTTLPPLAVIKWLAGDHVGRFGVPGDRMPPLSYILDWAWAHVAGRTPFSLRLFGLAFVTTAAVPLWAAARRVGGLWGACVACGFFFLSPNVITTAVEIRAYPFFLAMAAFGFWLLVRTVLDDGRRSIRSLWLLCLVAVLASYTHFFGLFFGGAVLVSALIVFYGQGRPLRHPLAAIGVFFVAVTGVLPFVRAAMHMTGDGSVSTSPYAEMLVRLAYRMVAHPASSIDVVSQWAYLVGIALIVAGGLCRLTAIEFRRPGAARLFSFPGDDTASIIGLVAVFAALAAGLTATVLASGLLGGGLVFKPSYNIWMVPGVLYSYIGIYQEYNGKYTDV